MEIEKLNYLRGKYFEDPNLRLAFTLENCTSDFIRGMIEDCIKIDNNGNLKVTFLNHKKNSLFEEWLHKQKLTFDHFSENCFQFTCWNSSELLTKLYDSTSKQTRNEEIYHQYLNIIMKTHEIPQIKIILSDPEAKMPFKIRSTDEGFDLTIIRKIKDLGKNTFMYDTGVAVQPPLGYYLEVYPRSSFGKTGYVFNNSVGLIDQGYTGTIKIIISKIDPSLPEIELPFTGFQLVVRRHVHATMIQNVENSFIPSSRGDGGHGSTNK